MNTCWKVEIQMIILVHINFLMIRQWKLIQTRYLEYWDKLHILSFSLLGWFKLCKKYCCLFVIITCNLGEENEEAVDVSQIVALLLSLDFDCNPKLWSSQRQKHVNRLVFITVKNLIFKVSVFSLLFYGVSCYTNIRLR